MNKPANILDKNYLVNKIRGLFSRAGKRKGKKTVQKNTQGWKTKWNGLKKMWPSIRENKLLSKIEFSSVIILSTILLVLLIAITPPIRAGILTILNLRGSGDKGKREEVVEKRTKFAKVFRNQNGTYTTVVFATPIHYMDGRGEWKDLEGNIFDNQAAGSSFFVRFGDTPGFEFISGATRINLTAQNTNPVTGKSDGNSITYVDAYDATDIKYSVGATRVEEEIILKSEAAPTTFSFQIQSNSPIPQMKNGELDFFDCKTLKPFARDAKGNLYPVEAELARLSDGDYLIIKAGGDWMKEAEYPIVIDPTITVQPGPTEGKDSYVDDSQPTTNYGTLVDIASYDNGSAKTRSYLQFDLSSVPKGSTVSSASLQLYTQDALGGNVYLRKVTSSWDETAITWNNQPLFEEVADTQVVDTVNTWFAWDISGMVKDWVTGKVINNGVALMTAETGTSSGGLFCSSDYSVDIDLRPKLVIDYILDNEAPGSSVQNPKENAFLKGTTYAISGTANDNPDGSGVSLVQVSTDGGSSWQDATGTDSWTYNWAIPPDGTYNIKSRAIDTAGNIETPSAGVNITVDNTPPSALIVSPVGGIISGHLSVSGTASDDNFKSYKLQYGAGATPASWTLFGAIHPNQVLSGNLGTGFTAGLSDGIYMIELVVEDMAGNFSTNSVQIIVDNDLVTADPHGDYEVDTDLCSMCHRSHTAVSDNLNLFPFSETLMCYQCHDGMGTVANILDEFDSRASHHPILDAFYDIGTGHFMVCSNCHNTHGNKDSLGNLYPMLLRAKTEDSYVYKGNDFCGACHGPTFSYIGGDHITDFTGEATHDLNTPNPPSGSEIKCVNCHEKHGSDYYRLTKKYEEELCYVCHNSSSLPNTLNNWDIQAQFGLTSRHDITSQDPGAKVECSSCHGPHVVQASSANMLSNPDNTKTLWTGSITSYCIKCHDGTAPSSVINSTTVVPYTVTMSIISPISSPFFTGWDKAPYLSVPAGMSATNACDTCHHPHGSNNQRLNAYNLDNSSSYKEENLCLTCHTLGGPAGAADIDAQLAKTYKHPVDTTSDIHVDTENKDNLSYDSSASKRHSECVDCHNPHEADAATASPPASSGVLRGIGGIRSDGTPINPIANQYELCFKCHSSYVTLPPGELDKAYQFNTSNESYHPVEAVGKNTGIDTNAFVSPITETSVLYCTDCHGNEDSAGAQCVVGSANDNILKLTYSSTDTSLCFSCHTQDSYSVGDPLTSASRWQKHRVSGHQNCADCHSSHGTNQAHLMNRGYNHDAGGGSIVTDVACTGSGCHNIGVWLSYTSAY